MRRQSGLLFDEYIGGITTAYTSPTFYQKISRWDQIAIFAVADNSSGSAPGFTIQIQHSNDGRNWYNKSSNNTTSPPGINGIPEVSNAGSAISVAAGAIISAYGADNGTAPFLGFVRLAIVTSGTAGGGMHLKVYVTGRDQS